MIPSRGGRMFMTLAAMIDVAYQETHEGVWVVQARRDRDLDVPLVEWMENCAREASNRHPDDLPEAILAFRELLNQPRPFLVLLGQMLRRDGSPPTPIMGIQGEDI